MAPWQILLCSLFLLSLLALLALLAALPGLRLRQVGRYLRDALRAPEEQGEPPRSLRAVGADLTAVRDRLILQAEEVRLQERRRQDLIAFLAHDLKTPLTSVLGYLELLRDEPGLSEEQRVKYTGVALDKAKRLEELVGEFFDINAMSLTAMEREDVQLSFLLEQLADEFYPLFAEKGLSCQPDIAPRLVVEGDPGRLARVFDNVLRNAISYSEPGCPVGLRAWAEGGQAVVRVTNEGLPIPEKELSNIFQKFYRLDAARSTRTGGAGLGLAIAREIVELHAGAIKAESTGRHTAFVVSLPLKRN